MSKSRFTEEQIADTLQQAEAGVPRDELRRRYGIGQATFYRWMAKYGGLSASELRRFKEREAENPRLKGLIAERSLEKKTLPP